MSDQKQQDDAVADLEAESPDFPENEDVAGKIPPESLDKKLAILCWQTPRERLKGLFKPRTEARRMVSRIVRCGLEEECRAFRYRLVKKYKGKVQPIKLAKKIAYWESLVEYNQRALDLVSDDVLNVRTAPREQFNESELTHAEAIEWVAAHLAVESIEPQDAPDARCWCMLNYYRTHQGEFWKTLYAKILPTRSQVRNVDEPTNSKVPEPDRAVRRTLDSLVKIAEGAGNG